MFLCAQVTWHCVKRLIRVLNKDRRSSLKAWRMWYISIHRRIIHRVIMIEIKIEENVFGALDHNRTDVVSCVFSSHAM